MGFLDDVKPIEEVSQGKLAILYGKSGCGKTWVGGTFPKPMLYIKIGDDGANTIKKVKGIDVIDLDDKLKEVKAKDKNATKAGILKTILKDLQKDKKYKSVFPDTFSLIVNEWKDENVIQKKKRMIQQDWGDLLNDTEEIIRLCHKLSKKKWVILSCHEVTDTIEGMEDELLPDVRCSVSKGARTYLEGMANYGIHCIKIQKEVENKKTGDTELKVKYAADIGPNPYYWTKLQVDPSTKVPKRIINPTFDKLMEIVNVE